MTAKRFKSLTNKMETLVNKMEVERATHNRVISEVVMKMNTILNELGYEPIGNDSHLRLQTVGVEPEIGPGNRSIDEGSSGRNERSRPENTEPS